MLRVLWPFDSHSVFIQNCIDVGVAPRAYPLEGMSTFDHVSESVPAFPGESILLRDVAK
jgi:hypothetical protein